MSKRHRLKPERRPDLFERCHNELQRETAERFARVEAQTAESIHVLTEHTRLLERLTEAILAFDFNAQP